MLDILITNGWVADGTGNPRYPADIAIRGDQVVEVGRLSGAQAATVIDATGKIVCLGFVDAHSHTDWISLPATSFGLHDRGLVRAGHRADLVVLDFDRLDDASTPQNPVAYVKGVEHVLVNGVPVVANGEHTGARPGRNLPRR